MSMETHLSRREEEARDAHFEQQAVERAGMREASLSNIRQSIRDFHRFFSLKAEDVEAIVNTIISNNAMSGNSVDGLCEIDFKD